MLSFNIYIKYNTYYNINAKRSELRSIRIFLFRIWLCLYSYTCRDVCCWWIKHVIFITRYPPHTHTHTHTHLPHTHARTHIVFGTTLSSHQLVNYYYYFIITVLLWRFPFFCNAYTTAIFGSHIHII